MTKPDPRQRMKLPKPAHEYGYTPSQIATILHERGIRNDAFWEAFGVNTCMEDKDLGTVYYPCDVERALWKLRAPGGAPHMED